MARHSRRVGMTEKVAGTSPASPLCMTPHIFNRMMFYALQKEIAETTGPFGLTPDRMRMLELVCSKAQTQASLAKELDVAKSAISQMVRALETLGFVARQPCATDARTLEVVPTPHGRATFEAWARAAIASSLEERLLERARQMRRMAPWLVGWGVPPEGRA